uniref:Uncharacterized protein n=1 Tax=Avena sativa TaxID=4498 RepID=A0ACD5ZXY9_AVESA
MLVSIFQATMDREGQQENGNVHDQLDLTIPSDDKDSFWNNLAIVDDDNNDDVDDDDDEDYTGASSSRRRKRRASKPAKRHCREQIQQLEAVFHECPHPDENKRLALAKKLGMGALQVKFWFQNRRSAKKNQLEKNENKALREENEALKAEHQAIKAALLTKACPTCGGQMVPREETPETQRLLMENARLKDLLFHKTSLLSQVSGKAPMPMPMPVPGSYGQLAADLDINMPACNSPVMDTRVGQLAVDLDINMPCNSPVMDTRAGQLAADLDINMPACNSPVMDTRVGQLAADLDINMPACNSPVMDTRVQQDCVRGSSTRADAQRTELLGRVLHARNEFMMMVKENEALWLPAVDGEVLNYQTYQVSFPAIFEVGLPGFAMNGTRDTDMVMGTGADIISILMDATRLCEAFPGIMGSVTSKNIAPPTGHQGQIQQMNANLMVPSPRMPTCKVMFVRHSWLIKPNVWAVVDVSVNDICGDDTASGVNTWINATHPMACRLLPSGCLVEDMKNGYCKVTWIVNAEYDKIVVPNLYHPLLLRSGHALGARRWLTSLKRRCQYLALLRLDSATYIGRTTGPIPPEGRNRVLELAQQTTARFLTTLCGAGHRGQAWGTVDELRKPCAVGAESFEVAMRVATLRTAGNAQGEQPGLIISAATTVWLLGTPGMHVFDYICANNRRGEWDTFSNDAPVQQEDYVAAIQSPRYAVSILHPKAAHRTNNEKLILQQVCADDSFMFVAYAPVEERSVKEVIRGGRAAVLSLLPSGFVILPDGHGDEQIPPVDTMRPSGSATTHRTNDGCIVSVMFQTLLRGATPENLIAQTINNVGNQLSRSIVKIKDAVHASVVVTA